MFFVAALGDRTATFKGSFLLALGVTTVGVLLFAYVLKIPFQIFKPDVLEWSNWFGWVDTVISTALTDLWYGFWRRVGAAQPAVVLHRRSHRQHGRRAARAWARWRPYRSCYRSRSGMKPVAAILMIGRRLLRRTVWRRDLLDFAELALSSAACGHVVWTDFPRDPAGQRRYLRLGITVIASFVGASMGHHGNDLPVPDPGEGGAAIRVQRRSVPSCCWVAGGIERLARGSLRQRRWPMTVLGLVDWHRRIRHRRPARPRFTFGLPQLDGRHRDRGAGARGCFGLAEFMASVNKISDVNTKYSNVRLRGHATEQRRPEKKRPCRCLTRHHHREPVRAHSRHRTDGLRLFGSWSIPCPRKRGENLDRPSDALVPGRHRGRGFLRAVPQVSTNRRQSSVRCRNEPRTGSR